MPHITDERSDASGEASEAERGRQRRWRLWALMSVLALGGAPWVAVLATGAADLPLTARAPASVTVGGTGVVRVLASTDQVRAGPGFPEINGVADGLGSLWLTGGTAGRNHVLYAVNPATSHTEGSAVLPPRLVINPNDIAVGSGAVWVAVGTSLYRIEPLSTVTGAVVTRAFATLPHGGLIGDVAIDAGSVWITDTTRGRVYRFAASTGRLETVVMVGSTAGAMTVGDGGIWVADSDAHTLARISVTHNRVNSVLTVPGVPSHIAASKGALWVTDGAAGTVTVLGSPPGRVTTVRVGGQPTGVAAVGDTVWVANTADGTLSRIDARRHMVVATVPVGVRPYALAADGQGVWVAVLGRPVMHVPSEPARKGPLAWLERLCGVG